MGFIPFMLFVGFGLYHARKLALGSPGTGLANLGAGIEIAHLGLCGLRAVGRLRADVVSLHLVGLAASAWRIQSRGETP